MDKYFREALDSYYRYRGTTGWKYPKLQELRKFQEKKGLTYSVLDDVEVREIICGISTTEEIEKFHEWIMEQLLKNQESFDSGVISMDVKDVKVSYYDVLQMAGKVVISKDCWRTDGNKLRERLCLETA